MILKSPSLPRNPDNEHKNPAVTSSSSAGKVTNYVIQEQTMERKAIALGIRTERVYFSYWL